MSKEDHGPKFEVDIEGSLYPWPQETITTEDIIRLGGWQASEGAVLVDRENNERNLVAGEVIELKPGHGFAKKVRFKRG